MSLVPAWLLPCVQGPSLRISSFPGFCFLPSALTRPKALCLSILTGVASRQERAPLPLSSSSENCRFQYLHFQAERADGAEHALPPTTSPLAKTKSGHTSSLSPRGHRLLSHVSACHPPGLLEQIPFGHLPPTGLMTSGLPHPLPHLSPTANLCVAGVQLLSPSEKNKDLNSK